MVGADEAALPFIRRAARHHATARAGPSRRRFSPCRSRARPSVRCPPRSFDFSAPNFVDVMHGGWALGVIGGADLGGGAVGSVEASHVDNIMWVSTGLRARPSRAIGTHMEAGLWFFATVGLGHELMYDRASGGARFRLPFFVGFPVPFTPGAWSTRAEDEGSFW